MKILYVRVSSVEQNTSRQLVHQNEYDRVFEEKISGKNRQRPQLQCMLNSLREGDEIEVYEMSRLGRNLKDLLDIVEEIIKNKCSIRFIKENLVFKDGKNDPYQKMMLEMFGSFCEFERALIKERQLEGIRILKEKGGYKKIHPKKLNNSIIIQIKEDRKAGDDERTLMNRYHISKPTLYRYLKCN